MTEQAGALPGKGGRLVAPAGAWQPANVGHLAVADAVAVAIAVALLTFFDSGPKTKTARGCAPLTSPHPLPSCHPFTLLSLYCLSLSFSLVVCCFSISCRTVNNADVACAVEQQQHNAQHQQQQQCLQNQKQQQQQKQEEEEQQQ